MALLELRFNGCNGHSRILSAGKDLIYPLTWLGELTILRIEKSEMLKGETQEEFYRWLIEEHKPQEAMYFARSDDYKNQYLGVQYYSVALPHDSLNPGIPVGPPQIMPRSMSLWKLPQYKDATGSIENSNHTVNLVQYYKSL